MDQRVVLKRIFFKVQLKLEMKRKNAAPPNKHVKTISIGTAKRKKLLLSDTQYPNCAPRFSTAKSKNVRDKPMIEARINPLLKSFLFEVCQISKKSQTRAVIGNISQFGEKKKIAPPTNRIIKEAKALKRGFGIL